MCETFSGDDINLNPKPQKAEVLQLLLSGDEQRAPLDGEVDPKP